VILTTQVNLDHLVFSRWFALFESLFPLEIQLLSPWFNISSFRRLQMTTWSHINGEILEHLSHTNIWHPLGGRGRAWRDRLAVFGSNRCRRWRCNISQPPACFIIVICRFSFARNYVENHVVLFQNSGHSHAAGCIPFFSSYAVLILHNGKIAGALSLNSNLWL